MDPRTNPQMLAKVAQRFGALADQTRLRILWELRQGEKNVGELSRQLSIAQPTVSKHLSVLLHAGLVQVRHERTQSIFQVADEGIYRMCDLVCGGVAQQLRREYEALGLDGTHPPHPRSVPGRPPHHQRNTRKGGPDQ